MVDHNSNPGPPNHPVTTPLDGATTPDDSFDTPFDAPFNVPRIAKGLTFAAAITDLERAVDTGSCLVQAPPGTGKTTIVPPVVANFVAARAGTVTRDGQSQAPTPAPRVIVTGPRRVVVRAAAQRLAHLTSTVVGDLVGYRVRGDACVSDATRIEFVTAGVLVRQLLSDPELPGVGAVILDEIHERGIDTDLLVGMLADVRELRDDLVLVAMSATLDAERFAPLIGTSESPAPRVDAPSALHPLTVSWAPYSSPRLDARGVAESFLDHVAQTAASSHRVALTQAPSTDALVFLPGVREVTRVAEALNELAPGSDVLMLHGQVDARDQDAALAGRSGDTPRIIVSTALAESSLTVPGVRLVIDAGLSREPRRDVARGMSGLVTVAASRASAEQRAGRAARVGPGRVVRCYDERTFERMPAHVTPEIATADLTDVALLLAAWGTPGGIGLRLPTTPPTASIRAAHTTLRTLDALDADGHLTELGRVLATLPIDVRLGRALLIAARDVGPQRAAEVVAALSDSPRVRSADLAELLSQLRGEASVKSGGDAGRFRRDAARLRRLAQGTTTRPDAPTGDRKRAATPASSGASIEAAAGCARDTLLDGYVVALAFPDRVARRVSPGIYLTAGGTRAAIAQASPLRDCEWLAVADVTRSESPAAQGTGALIRLGAELTRELAERAASQLLTDEVRAEWNTRTGSVSARRVKALGAIEFSATPTSPTPQAARDAVRHALKQRGLELLQWNDSAQDLRRRMAFVHHHLADPWPDVCDHALLERLDEWFGPELDALARGRSASSVDVVEPLRRLLPWPEAARFDELAPERLKVPSGSRIRLQYPEIDSPGDPVVVAVKLQECFGLETTPTLADGRASVQFHLLSPAGRPLAITDDLGSFWRGPYAQVRAEMRGRYPKHPWPEDPATHVATAHTNRRLRNG